MHLWLGNRAPQLPASVPLLCGVRSLPLLVDYVSCPLGARRFHFERFWPKMDGFLDVVSLTWNVVVPDPDPLRHIYARLKATARRLHSWGALTLGDIATQLLLSRELIARLDEAKDKRALSPAEFWL